MTAEDVIRILKLEPHPEGGAFRETYRSKISTHTDGSRSAGTAIYFLLRARQRSEWHRVASDEIYHFYFGSPLELSLISPGEDFSKVVLGTRLDMDERPQVLVPAHYWQSAQAAGGFTLLGCTVSPGFEFADFEMSDQEKLESLFPHLKNI